MARTPNDPPPLPPGFVKQWPAYNTLPLRGPLPPHTVQCSGVLRLRGATRGKQPQRRLDRRLEEVAKAVGGGYCRLQMPLKLALGVRETVAGRRLGALEGGGGRNMIKIPSRPGFKRGGGLGGFRCTGLQSRGLGKN